MSRKTVVATLRRQLRTLRAEYGLKHLSLFGSTARNEARRRSDIDLLAEFDRPVSLFDLVRVQTRLESILGRKVDLATPGSLNERLQRNIERDLIRVA